MTSHAADAGRKASGGSRARSTEILAAAARLEASHLQSTHASAPVGDVA